MRSAHHCVSAREVEVGIGGDDRSAARRGRLAQRRRDDHAAGLRWRRAAAGSCGLARKLSCVDGVARFERRDARRSAQPRVADQLAAERCDDVAEAAARVTRGLTCRPAALSALITLSVMSMLGADVDRFLQDQVVLLGLGDLLDRPGWRARRPLRAPRSCAGSGLPGTRGACAGSRGPGRPARAGARARSALGQRRRVLVELVAGGLQRGCRGRSVPSRAWRTRPRAWPAPPWPGSASRSTRSVLTKPIFSSWACAPAAPAPAAPAATSDCTATGASSERGSDLELKSLDSIVRLNLRIGCAVAELQRADRRDPADRPTPTEARRLVERRPSRPRPRRCRRRRSRTGAACGRCRRRGTGRRARR